MDNRDQFGRPLRDQYPRPLTSHNGTTPEQLEQVSPRLAVIPVGSVEREHPFSAWAHGHPRLTVLKLLEEAVTDDPLRAGRSSPATGAKKFEVA